MRMVKTFMDLSQEQNLAEKLARTAGAMALRLRKSLNITYKPFGQGPVTNADIAIDDYICKHILEAFPTDGIISEESYSEHAPFVAHKRLWFIDPIDGTSSYIAGGDDFVIMIGLAIDSVARMGVVYQPARDRLWRGVFTEQASIAERIFGDSCQSVQITRRTNTPDPITLLLSRTHRSFRQDWLIEALKPQKLVYRSSVGLKAMLILEHQADLYVAWSRQIKMWDTCAPMAIIKAASATMCFVDGSEIHYREEISHGKAIMIAGFVPDERLIGILSEIAARPIEFKQE